MSDIILNTLLPVPYFIFCHLDLSVTVTVNFIFTLGEPNAYKPHGFFLGFLPTFIFFCVTVLFNHFLYIVVNKKRKK